MGKHFRMKRLDDRKYHKQPGCVWALVHALDYHHWQSNVRKMIKPHKHEGQVDGKCDWSPRTNSYERGDYEAEKLLVQKESSYPHTERSRQTKKRSLKGRTKEFVAEEISKESDNIRGKDGSFKSKLQRTYSIHHLESLDSDCMHSIVLFPRNADDCAPQSLDMVKGIAAGSQEASGGRSNALNTKDITEQDSKEDRDVLEIFKVDKGLLIKHLQDADETIANFSRGALGLTTKAKLNKSRSFPLSESSQRRKLKPIKLESKQREVWSFPRKDKLHTVNQAPRSDYSDHFGSISGEVAGNVESNDTSGLGRMIKQVSQTTNEFVMPSYIGSNMVKSDADTNKFPNRLLLLESFGETADVKSKNIMDSFGEKQDQTGIRNFAHHRSSSLNESLDKYARLLENSFQTDVKLSPSRSLKLTCEYGHAPVYFKRMRTLSYVDFYYSSSDFQAIGDGPPGGGSMVTAKDTSLGLQKSEQENLASLPITNKENGPNTNMTDICQKTPFDIRNSMQIKEDDASVTLLTSDASVKVDELREEANKLKRSSLVEQETDCSEITHEELRDQGLISDSDTCLQETDSYAVELQFSEVTTSGLEQGSCIDEWKFSVDSKDMKSLRSKPLLTNSKLNVENDEISYKVINSLVHDACPKKNDSDLYYVRHLLDQSGIAKDASIWHASNQPISPNLFDEVEADWPHKKDQLTGWPDFYGCWHHQMLFDLVNEVILEVYDLSLPYYPKALSSSCHVRPFPVRNCIIEEVSTSIGMLLNLKPEEKLSLDSIVSRDLTHDHCWMNLQLETECVALELEDIIFDELLEEIMLS